MSAPDVRVELVDQLRPELAQELGPILGQLGGRGADETALQRVADGASILLLERVSGRVAGTACLVPVWTATGLRGRLEELVVDEGARGRGVGEALVRAVIAEAWGRGMRELELTSGSHRDAANRLYGRLGFEAVNTNVFRLPL